MKRKTLVVFFIVALAAMVSAQDGSRRDRSPMGQAPRERAPTERSYNRSPARETVTVSGTMVVANGMPALRSGDDTYLIGGVSRLIGYIDGLKEGAQVTVEGRVITIPWRTGLKFLQGSKLTLGGKSYDLSSSSGLGMGMMMGMGMWYNPRTPRAPQVPSTPQRFPRR